MKCKDCPDYHDGHCTCIGEDNCAFPVAPDSDCVLDAMERAADAEFKEEKKLNIPEQDSTIFPDFSGFTEDDVTRRIDDLAEQIEDEDPFCGSTQDAEKLALCKHIGEMADAIKRVAPYHIMLRASDVNDNSARSWALHLDLHSPTVFLSLQLRKRLCEMLLAADEVTITADKKGEYTRFSCIVKDLWY